MARRSVLKKNISNVCELIMAECLAISLYGNEQEAENAVNATYAMVRLESDYRSRISHVEPGMKAKVYFNKLISDFNKDIQDITERL